MNKCPSCTEWVSDKPFCFMCGAEMKKMKEPILCGCGEPIHTANNFCENCGKPREQIEKENVEAHEVDMQENVLAKEKQHGYI